MSLSEAQLFLAELEALDIRFEIAEGRLRYSAPKQVMTAARLAQLRQHKDELLQLLSSRQAPPLDETPIPVQERGAGLVLSAAQHRMWFLDRLEGGGSSSYNMPPILLNFTGPLDVEALRLALDAVVQRHEVLHSAFRTDDGEPRQFPLNEVTLELPVTDLSGESDSSQQTKINTIVRTQSERPFDLRGGEILLRAELVKLAPQNHVFALTMHHIISDGWSIAIFVREVSTLYEGSVRNEPVALPPLPIQYADYAVWERQWLASARSETQRSYWREQLTGAPQVLELPTDHPRPKAPRYLGHTEYLHFDATFHARFKTFCTEAGVTPYMALITAYAALLHRYARQDEFVVGSPIAVRPHPQTEDLIGLFLNTIALRFDLRDEPTFDELLRHVRQVAINAFQHRELPLEQVLQQLDIDRHVEHAPLFQVLFGMQNAPAEPTRLVGLQITPLPPQDLYAVYDLVLNFEETEQGLEGKLRGNSDLFERATLRRMAGHYRALVEQMVDDSTQTVSSTQILTEQEVEELVSWSRPNSVHATETTIADQFELRVSQTPSAAAVTLGEQTLTYAELNEQANHLAHQLINLGVGPDDLVGVAAERSVEMVVALLAILKAGGAYLPLDPTYPAARLEYMMQDAGIVVLLTQKNLTTLPPPPEGTPVVDIVDIDQSFARPMARTNPIRPITPDNLAYVIYTSGSTGRPKGVQVEHRQVIRLLTTCETYFDFGPDDVWTLFHSYAFDFSVWELWGPLLYGGRLVVVPHDVSRSPEQFHELVTREGVTVLNQTPSAFRQFIRVDGEVSADHRLKWVIFGGEALEFGSLKPWIARHGDTRPQLVNMYGITETTVHASYHRITEADVDAGAGSVIGKPLDDLGLFIVDDHLQPVPPGVPGEILVGGGGVARGYLQRPELTTERFIPVEQCRFAVTAGATGRLYRSGDQARWLAGGDLEYLGRIDQQVKIRGFRIELGEIEAVLSDDAGVAEVVVNCVDGERLIAYIVPKSGTNSVTAPHLRSLAQKALASYMVPAAFVFLDTIPLTSNGKVDRRALPDPDADRQDLASRFVAPSTPLESLIAEHWQQALSLTQVGVHDNFFELGGDSIKAAVFVNRLQQALDSIIYVVALFEAPTIALLVEWLNDRFPDAVTSFEGRREDSTARTTRPRVDATRLAKFRSYLPDMESPAPQPSKLGRAIFVLSPPRSGSTLMRVVLGGHPQLFAPPELELLSFDDMAQRRDTYTGGLTLYLEGAIRALMELQDCDAETASTMIDERESTKQPVAQFYRELQQLAGTRQLVDKTPSYALNPQTLQRAEALFEEPLYIHLQRHPCGMIRSFEKASLEQIFFRYEHDFGTEELAELIWLHSHTTIRDFLDTVPAERQIDVSFEALTAEPEAQAHRLCQWLGISFHEAMLQPYADRSQRMTDGLHQVSRMIGDTRFHEHDGIEADVAERWRQNYREADLGEPTQALAKQLGYHIVTATSITRQKHDGVVLPSLAQQRLWFLDQLEGAGTAYTMPGILHLEGPLQPDALERSLSEIIQRHEILRSRFEVREGEPVVCIDVEQPVLEQIDLRGLPEAMRAAEVERHAPEDAQRPFDLATGPLLRAALLSLEPEHHVLLVNMHHIVSDGWSMGILMREWSALYNAFVNGKPSPLSPLSIHYSDYALWQRDVLQGAELRRQIDYWRAHLDGAPDLLELPTDRPRPVVQRYRGATHSLHIHPELVAELRHLGEDSQATLFMVLLGAFSVLLSRYATQPDVIIGSPVANRSRTEFEDLIGFFVNTVPLRLAVESVTSFRDLLRQARQTALGAYAHQELSFEQLVEELEPPRNLSHAPIFQVLLSLQHEPTAPPQFEGLTVRPQQTDAGVAKYDLSLLLDEQAGGLSGVFEYNTDLFDGATIARMAGSLQTLLAAVTADPERPVGQLPLLNTDESRQLLIEHNSTRRSLPPAGTVHDLVEQQVDTAPEAVAVEFNGKQQTYADLDRQANRLARRLQALGVGAGARVGLCLPRSLELPAALLGILKAGASYVPLDPTFPPARLAFIAEDAELDLIITTSALQTCVPAPSPRLLIDVERAAIDANDDTRLAAVSPESLAYTIYTSGSTGRPKGVMIEHRSVVNFLLSMGRRPGLKATDALFAITTISFDIAVLELYLPLVVGARIVLADDETARDGLLLAAALTRSGATCLQATPATWRMLLAAGWLPHSGLKALCGGEALAGDLAAQLLPHCDQLWNMYGPTETTVWSTVRQLSEGDLVSVSLPIGKPIDNTTTYVLDDTDQPVPIGVTGELCIGGIGLARGYHEQPELMAEKFVHLDVGCGVERLYRTGDRARWRADGVLVCLGRLDDQLKVRGFRIEPGEIAHELEQEPAVDGAAVIVDHTADDARLVAFFTTTSPGSTSADALRLRLRLTLPEYMIPSLFVELESLPLTPNGKIDRRALRVPADAGKSIGGRLPRDPVELQLVEIWQDLLDQTTVGVQDNFFDLGGHSLVAVRLMAQIADRFSRHLPLAALFQGATIEQLANLLRTDEDAMSWSSVVTVRSTGSQSPLFCVAGAGGNVVYFHELARQLPEERPFYALQPPGLDGTTEPLATVEALASHYVREMRAVQSEGPYLIGGHSFGGLVAFEMVRQLETEDEAVEALLLLDAAAPHFQQPTGKNWDEARWLSQVADIASHLYRVDLDIDYERLSALEGDEQLPCLHRELVRVGVLAAGAPPRHFHGFVQVYKANLRATYTAPETPLQSRVVLFRSRQAQPDQLIAETTDAVRADPNLGWAQYVAGEVEVHDVDGDHLTMMRTPQVASLARSIELAVTN